MQDLSVQDVMQEKINLSISKFEKSVKYLSRYIEVDDVIKKRIIRHSVYFRMAPEVCAWYRDWEDMCSDWESLGYSRTEIRKMRHGGIGEFMTLPNGLGIVRFVV